MSEHDLGSCGGSSYCVICAAQRARESDEVRQRTAAEILASKATATPDQFVIYEVKADSWENGIRQAIDEVALLRDHYKALLTKELMWCTGSEFEGTRSRQWACEGIISLLEQRLKEGFRCVSLSPPAPAVAAPTSTSNSADSPEPSRQPS